MVVSGRVFTPLPRERVLTLMTASRFGGGHVHRTLRSCEAARVLTLIGHIDGFLVLR